MRPRHLRRLLLLLLAVAVLYAAYRVALVQHAAERAADRRAHLQDHQQGRSAD